MSFVNKIIKIIPVIGLGLPVVTAWNQAGGDVGAFVDRLKAWYFASQPDGTMKFEDLFRGWGPLFVGLLVVAGVKLAPKIIQAIIKAFT